ncbi:MAG TPA: hypothetical protein PLT27_11950 [Nitrospira sp.]|nr:hypothetical protein [Nitrospira sp.]
MVDGKLESVRDQALLSGKGGTMAASMILRIKLGPFVSFEVEGENCEEICQSLKGFEKLNERVDSMCSDLVDRLYPEGLAVESEAEQEEKS